jgi:hypothetical protein
VNGGQLGAGCRVPGAGRGMPETGGAGSRVPGAGNGGCRVPGAGGKVVGYPAALWAEFYGTPLAADLVGAAVGLGGLRLLVAAR